MRQDWLYGRPYPLGIFLIYKSLTKLFCAITKTRPKVLFPAKPTAATETAVKEGNPSDVLTFARRRGRPKKQSLSDMPDYVRYDELPRTVCYGDVDLFVIRNPEDVQAGIIVFTAKQYELWRLYPPSPLARGSPASWTLSPHG
jgi:hypothetical protein